MLSKREKQGVLMLLDKMPQEELKQLAGTVTNRLITLQSKGEAIKAIIMYTDNAEEFLRRKRVKRDLLFTYLAECNVAISPQSDKSALIRRVMEYWQSPPVAEQSVRLAKDTHCELKREEVSRAERPVTSQHRENTSTSSLHKGSKETDTTHWSQELAKQFSSWFFSQLNLMHPMNVQQSADWGPQHFLPDACLKLYVIRGSQKDLETYEGSDLVANRLKCLVSDEELIFNPNLLPDGTRGRSESHGLVVTMVCGTLHQASNCVGVFEQSTGLVRDPLADNKWKVKYVNLQIKCSSPSQMPTLEGSGDQLALTS
ncbi:uncharacterized protein C3orf38 homolog [Diadema antillarum]|uniref:uncharacterized protein C3orf38 homolog n=1 Tax=Diadema antillarum TaxID=105358 RepID=UPI003A8B6524